MGKSLPLVSDCWRVRAASLPIWRKKGMLLNSHQPYQRTVSVDKKLILAFFQELRSNSLNYNGPEEPELALILGRRHAEPRAWRLLTLSSRALVFSQALDALLVRQQGPGLERSGFRAQLARNATPKQMDGENWLKIDDTIILILPL
jgi:hypothetical protein